MPPPKAELGTAGAMWGGLALALVAWVILLGGVAAMQQACGSGDPNGLLTAGAAGYLAPVSCKKFFSYTWWVSCSVLFSF